MKIQKTDGLYRKPRLHAATKVPLLVWLPLVLGAFAVLVVFSLKTSLLQEQSVPEIHTIRKHAFRVAAVGDIACSPNDMNFNEGEGITNGCQQQAIGNTIEGENTDAVFLVGDLQDEGTFENFERSFVPYWRDVASPIYSVPGERDYYNGTLDGYKQALNTYFPKSIHEKEGKPYYQFGLGQWDVFALDSTCVTAEECGFDSSQYNWLTSKVNLGVSSCSVAFWHHPSISSAADNGARTSADDFMRLATESGFDIVINAHDRHYERLKFGTTRQFIAGTGGINTKKTVTETPGSEKIIDDNFGYLYLELFPGRYTWEFKDVLGEALDSGGDTCSP